MHEIAEIWSRILAWYQINVPNYSVVLSGGATATEIELAEKEMGVKLPTDVKTSYRLFDGSGGISVFPYAHLLYSIKEIILHWAEFVQTLRTGVLDSVAINNGQPHKQFWWHPNWIPLTGNAGGGYFFVDLDPDAGGTVGQIIEFSLDVGPVSVVAPSFYVWLSDFAGALESRSIHLTHLTAGWCPLRTAKVTTPCIRDCRSARPIDRRGDYHSWGGDRGGAVLSFSQRLQKLVKRGGKKAKFRKRRTQLNSRNELRPLRHLFSSARDRCRCWTCWPANGPG
jgi:cell wall assembly regulator SMI1